MYSRLTGTGFPEAASARRDAASAHARRAQDCPRCAGAPRTNDACPKCGSVPAAENSAPLPSSVQASLEPRLGHSLESIRVHADSDAASRAERRGALAFTAGRHIYFGAGAYRPGTPAGDWILGHEATHAVQQGLAEVAEEGLPNVAEAVGESEAHRVAWGGSARIGTARPPAAMALTLAQFKAQLGSTPEQAFAIDTLFADPTFAAILSWMAGCTATPAQDLGPLELLVTPGLTSGGVVRFGGYSPFSRTLEINPTKPEHIENPAELVDTVFHELIHAADDLDAACQAAGAAAAPLAGAATSTLPPRASVGRLRELIFNITQGPGASDPCGEFIDINHAAQAMVTSAIQANIQVTGVGRPTLTFVNMIIRSNPAALSSYETCRRSACALSGAALTTALGACSNETIAKFLPPSMLSALLPAHVHFDFGDPAVRADQNGKLDMVAGFLVHHPAQTVEIVGHADPVGGATRNLRLGQDRADAVHAALIARGVPAGQIRGTPRSEGETRTLSTSSSEHWRDRRVEILP